MFLNESLTGDPWNGRADLPLTREWFGITSTVHVARIKVEIFLMDSKECSSYSSPIEYLELRKGAEVENSHWVPVRRNIGGIFSNILMIILSLSFTSFVDKSHSESGGDIGADRNRVHIQEE